ncbi:MAG: hypothetical protein ACO2ZZ_07035 [Cyclobacteriaceae bacterium]
MKTNLACVSTMIILFVVSTNIQAQDDYTMFLGMYLDPIPGQSVELVKGVKAHNAKYHAEGDDKAYLWNILTGPRSGQFSWAQGPIKYAKLNEALSEEHQMDWDSNVASKCRNVGEIRMFRRAEDHTYNPEGEVIGKNVLARMFYGVSDQGAAMEVVLKIKETLEANKADYARRVYVTDFRTRENESIMLIYPFDDWTEMETRKGLGPNFGEQFDKVHGDGAWAKNSEKLSASTEGWYDEIRVMVE